MRLFPLLLFVFIVGGLQAQWVSIGSKEVKKLCKEKIRVFELEEYNEASKALNQKIRNYFTKEWDLCPVQFIAHQENNPEYEKEGFHILFYFQLNKANKKEKIEKDFYSFHVNFNNCKPSDREKEHYRASLVSFDLLTDIPVSPVIEGVEDERKAILQYTYDKGIGNKLSLTLHCFQNLLKDIKELRKPDLEALAQKNIKEKQFPIVVFSKGDLPKNLNEEKDFKKFTEKKVLVVEEEYFKNSKQGFVDVGVVLIFPYRNPDNSDTISVYEINSGKLIGRFNTVLDKAGNLSKKEVIQILDAMAAQA